MKKIFLTQVILSFTLISCQQKNNDKAKTEPNTKSEMKTVNHSTSNLDFENVKFGSNVNEVLQLMGLTLNDNASNEYNISGDYEEFQFPNEKKSKLIVFGNPLLSTDNISFFYFKANKKIWCYEMELINRKNSTDIISSITKTIGSKPSYFEKNINTKERPIFLDENGEQQKDHIEETKEVWEDTKNKITYFFINKINFSKNEMNLKIFALDKNSPKYKEWISYRSFDMFYNK